MQEVEIIRASELLRRFGVETITNDGAYRSPFEVMRDIAEILRTQRLQMDENDFSIFYTSLMQAILGLRNYNAFLLGGSSLDKTIFKCGFCQKVYSSIEERMSCEQKCLHEKQENERLAEKKRLLEEQKNRQTELIECYKRLERLRDEYIEDYGVQGLPHPNRIVAWIEHM